MKTLKNKIASVLTISLLATTYFPAAALADTNAWPESQLQTIEYVAEPITDIDTLQYRIDNHINDIVIEGLQTEATERIVDNGNVKMIESAPTIQKVKAVRMANGDLEETYVATSLGEMQTRDTSGTTGSLFVSSVDYVVRQYFTKSYIIGATGYPCYKPTAGEVAITATRDNFTVTRLDIITGGNGFAYDANGTLSGFKDCTNIDSKSGANVASLYKAVNCPYYFEALPSGGGSGIGTRGTITAKHGGNTYTGETETEMLGSPGGL